MRKRPEPEWEDDRPLDEYQAEKFMQKADRRARKLERLFKKYEGDPDADAKIAREMGWDKLSDPGPAEAEPPSSMSEEGPKGAEFEQNPLYQKGLKFALYLMRVVRLYTPKGAKRRPKWIDEAATWGMTIGGKLAAGLGRLDEDEIGFSIAQLKRALRASHHTLRALKGIRERGLLPAKAIERVTSRLIDLRDEIVGEVMSLRDQWNARFGR